MTAKRLLSSAVFCLSLLSIGRADVQFTEKQHESETDILRRWLNDKRMVTLRELGGDLSLSGEARVEFQDISQKNDGIQQLGQEGAAKKPGQSWDVEVNLMLDYRTDFTWSAVKLEFDNDMGVRSGTVNKIRVEKAYLGGRFIAGDTFTWDGEIGRRYFNAVFDSKIEFGSFFDGALFRLSKAFLSIGDFYFNPGAFLVDDKTNHYGFIAELGGLKIANCGLGMKYSIIDWKKYFPNPQKDDRYNYVVQQFLVLYQFNPGWSGKRLVKFYAAGLTNLIADDLVLPIAYPDPIPKTPPPGPTKNFGKQNWAWYAGVSVGQIKKQGDFAIDMDYQWVQAQSVPEFDFSGIGRYNAAKAGLYTTNTDGSGDYTIVSNATGPCNYQGFEVDLLYAFTNNLTVEENFKWSTTLDKQIGPDIKYKQFEVEFIYAF